MILKKWAYIWRHKIETIILYNIFINKMELPSRPLLLIREYSKPLTRHDWRTMRKMTNYKLYNIIERVATRNVKLVMLIQTNMRESVWYQLFSFMQVWGLQNTAECHHISQEELLKMDGMREAVIINIHRMEFIRMKRDNGYI